MAENARAHAARALLDDVMRLQHGTRDGQEPRALCPQKRPHTGNSSRKAQPKKCGVGTGLTLRLNIG
ncbi:hypothetical protein NDU88_001580 [Pleurodeles waltl]|uniref:Uncharacterized protein n=1 Tax=Pleurodeles waltl TaxID=8319 RepID=A0AAV7T0P0_PLEWA|nr:hypothetical protein NDU88_001580 [Pleurodeles waltl]